MYTEVSIQLLTWKDLTLSVLCTYSLGGKVYDYNYQGLMYTTTNGPGVLYIKMY